MRWLFGKKTLLAISLISFQSALAAVTPDSLMFARWAREARNRQFSAKLEKGHAEIELAHATYEYKLNARLVEKQAAAAIKTYEAATDQLRAQFELNRAEYHLISAQIEEQIWMLRSQWLADEKDPSEVKLVDANAKPGEKPAAVIDEKKVHSRQIADLHLKLGEKRLEIINSLADKSIPFLENIQVQYKSAANLRSKGMMASEEFTLIDLQRVEAEGLAKEAEAERAEAQSELNEIRNTSRNLQ